MGHNYTGRLSHAIVVEILDTMATEGSVEWAGAEASGGGSSSSVGGLGLAGVGGGLGAAVSGGAGKITVIVWWRKPEEWANMIYDWVRLLQLEALSLLSRKVPQVHHAWGGNEARKRKLTITQH